MEEPLRICKECGKKAFTDDDLKAFCTDKKMLYGRQNLCKDCYNKRIQKNGRYYEKQLKTSLAWKHRNKERLKRYDKKRYDGSSEYFKEFRERRIRVDNKTAYIEENPRKGICFFCGVMDNNGVNMQNSIHHWAYDNENYLGYSIELCSSCHKKLPKTIWVECDCGLKYDGLLYSYCPNCNIINPVFDKKEREKYIEKIRNLL